MSWPSHSRRPLSFTHPITVREMMARFIPKPLVESTIPSPRRLPPPPARPPLRPLSRFHDIEEKGLRAVIHSVLTTRLLVALDEHLPAGVLAPEYLLRGISSKLEATEYDELIPIKNEADFSGEMRHTFRQHVNLIMNSRVLVDRFCGRLVRDTIAAMMELKLSREIMDTEEPARKVPQLLDEASELNGKRVVLTGEGNVGVVDGDGKPFEDIKYWADIVVQLWEQFHQSNTNILILSSDDYQSNATLYARHLARRVEDGRIGRFTFLLLELVGKAICETDEEMCLLSIETKLAVRSLYESLHRVRRPR
ncbi:hypothetical protein IAR50_005322 [Cryptococcus sp. DSM 104548]